METINYKDSFVKVYHLKKLQMYLNPRKCYCCNENIGSDENVINSWRKPIGLPMG